MAGYQKTEVLIREELDELVEEGRVIDRAECEKRISECEGDKVKLNALYDELMALPFREDFAYVEPSDWEEIKKTISAAVNSFQKR